MPSHLKALDSLRLLPEETAGTLARLELMARAKMLGSITGRHTSPHMGASVEFAEHRQYAPGDDLRNLDWRVYGKVDRYYIKQYIEETNLRATLVLDASASMRFTGEAASVIGGERLSKFAYGRYLAAAIAYLLIRQQDAVGLATLDTAVRDYVRAASRPSQVRRILEVLGATEPGGETGLSGTLHEVAEKIAPRGLVIVISDFFDDPERLAEAFHHFNFRNHELVLLHVMADEELTFPYDRFHEFRNLEIDGNRIKVDPRSIRAAYLREVRGFVQALESVCNRLKADYVPVNTREPYDRVLSEYLAGRRAKKG